MFSEEIKVMFCENTGQCAYVGGHPDLPEKLGFETVLGITRLSCHSLIQTQDPLILTFRCGSNGVLYGTG